MYLSALLFMQTSIVAHANSRIFTDVDLSNEVALMLQEDSTTSIFTKNRHCVDNCSELVLHDNYILTFQLEQYKHLYIVTVQLTKRNTIVDTWTIQGQTLEQLAIKIVGLVRSIDSTSQQSTPFTDSQRNNLITNRIESTFTDSIFQRSPSQNSTIVETSQDRSAISKKQLVTFGRPSLNTKNSISITFQSMQNWGQFNIGQHYIYDSMPEETIDSILEESSDFDQSWNTYYQETYHVQNKSNQSLGVQYTRTLNQFIDISIAVSQLQNPSKLLRGVYGELETNMHQFVNRNLIYKPIEAQTKFKTYPISLTEYIAPFLSVGTSSIYLPGIAENQLHGLEYSLINPVYLHKIDYGVGMSISVNRLFVDIDYVQGMWLSDLPSRKHIQNSTLETIEDSERSIPYVKNNNDTPNSLTLGLGVRF